MVLKLLNSALKTFVLATIVASAVHAAEAPTYRYKDDRGQTVHSSTVPPQYVKNGYDVLNSRGQVIQTVPRALTGEELAAQEALREQQLLEEAAAKEALERDNLLLRLYRSPDEIARKRDERVTLIDGQLTALVAALEKVEAEVTSLQGTVDNYAKQSKEPPAQITENLRVQGAELERLTTQRTRLETDRATAVAEADRDMQRLSELMGLSPESAEETEAD